MSFAENIGEYIAKNKSKKLSCKDSHKRLDYAKQYAADALKTTSKIVIEKSAEATGDLIGNKVAHSITKVSRR